MKRLFKKASPYGEFFEIRGTGWAAASAIFTLLSLASVIALAMLKLEEARGSGDLPTSHTRNIVILTIGAAVASFLSWSLKNKHKAVTVARESRETETLLRKISPLIAELLPLQGSQNSDKDTQFYTRAVAKAMFDVLQPEGVPRVRSCLYRLASGNTASMKDMAPEGEEGPQRGGSTVETMRLVRTAAWGGRRDAPRASFDAKSKLGAEVLKRIAVDMQPIVCHDTEKGRTECGMELEKPEEAKRNRPYRSFYSVPIIDDNGECVGMLTCDHPDANFFNDHRQFLMQSMEQFCAIGFDMLRRPKGYLNSQGGRPARIIIGNRVGGPAESRPVQPASRRGRPADVSEARSMVSTKDDEEGTSTRGGDGDGVSP